jgi:four helix bundle protein
MANGEWGDAVTIQSYRDLTIWQDAIALATDLYRRTSAFPKEELYGLTSQLRRAAVSVAANIAEGHGREHTKSFIQFLRMAQGSLKEVETHLIIAENIGLLSSEASLAELKKAESLGNRIRSLNRALQERLEGED